MQRYSAAVRSALTYVGWWVVLFWVWLLYQGEWNKVEWVAAACAATLGAAFATLVAHVGLMRFRVPARALAGAARVPVQIVVDFAIVTRALVERLGGRSVEGTFVVRHFPSAGSGAVAAGDRAVRAILATYSPNAYVVDLDASHHTVLLHDLVPNRKSEEPA